MTSPNSTTTAPREPQAPTPGLGLGPAQIAASALAAVTSALAASFLGVAGTIIGAAVGSVVATVGAAVRQEQVRVLIERLTADVPVDPEQRTREQQARWVLAYLLDWHRREVKATWWEYFRLAALTADELIDERTALARLTLVGTIDQTKQA